MTKIRSHPFHPQLFSCLKEGFTQSIVLQDLLAGLVVGVIALPLAMAFAMGSGVAPERGLFTAIVAGLVVGVFGGSRYQIAGPTGAFVVVVFGIIQRQGYEGLVLAMLIAGPLLILMGFFRLGNFLKFIPYPVVTGMTSGIAVVLFTSQIRDFLGLRGTTQSVDFFSRWSSYFQQISTFNLQALVIALLVIALIVSLRRLNNKIPGAIIGVVLAGLIVYIFSLPVETIESRFGSIPRALPLPSWPDVSFDRLRELVPDAITIALLAGIESLLSAVVADSIMGSRHRPNTELIAQGMANMGAALFGGIPVTGAIARTVTNCRLGAKTPLSAIVHALVLVGILYGLSGLAAKIPLSSLAAIVVLIAWTMFEREGVKAIFRSSLGDVLLFLSTFILTILIDITVAVEVGVLLAALIFMKKMADLIILQKTIKGKIELITIKGPLFFAASEILEEHPLSEAIVLNLHEVALIDATGIQALKKFFTKCAKRGQKLILVAANPMIISLLENAHFFKQFPRGQIVERDAVAMGLAEELISGV